MTRGERSVTRTTHWLAPRARLVPALTAVLLGSGCGAVDTREDATRLSARQPVGGAHDPQADDLERSVAARSIYLGAAELYARSDVDTAIVELQRCLQMAPTYAPAWFKLSLCWYRRELYAKEIEALEKCIAYEPDYLEAHLNLGHAYLSQERLDDARQHYEKVLSLQPDHLIANYDAGLIYFDLGQFDKATAHLSRYLRDAPKNHGLREKARHYLNRCEAGK